MFKKLREVCIVAAGRSPLCNFKGNFENMESSQLAAETLSAIVSKYRINPTFIDEFYLGSVFIANTGQNLAKKVINESKLPDKIISHTVNQGSNSGMLASILGTMSIWQGIENVIICGGVDVASKAPLIYPRLEKLEGTCKDPINDELLRDSTFNLSLEEIIQKFSEKFPISEKELEDYSKKNLEKAANAWKNGKFLNEVVPVNGKNGFVQMDTIKNYSNPENKAPSSLNSAEISDGAAFIILSTREQAERFNWKVLATVESFAHSSQSSLDFATSPSLSIQKLLSNKKISLKDIDAFEINDQFAAIGIATEKKLGIDEKKINLYGGSLSLGESIGSAGVRIIVTLLSVLRQEKKKYGIASICSGEGDSSSILIKNEF